MVRATQFEYHHQLLLHLLVVGAAWLTYLVDPVDVVWAMVEHRPHTRALERLCFALATLFIGAGAALRTWAVASDSLASGNGRPGQPHPERHVGSLLFSIGLGSLVPLAGFLILTAGEAILAGRLILFEQSLAAEAFPSALSRRSVADAFRLESAKWGIFLAMIVFTLLLADRVADVLVAASLVLWVLLNCGPLRKRAIS
jgi:hypothetical protein